MRKSLRVVGLAWLAVALPARAETATASLGVSATVVSRCSVSAGALAFGAYAQGTNASQSSTLTVNCTLGTGYAVALDEGTTGGRRMSGPGGAALAYDIYRDEARSQRWGGGANAATGVGSGDEQALRLYAAIAPSEATAGSYSDTVTVSVIY